MTETALRNNTTRDRRPPRGVAGTGGEIVLSVEGLGVTFQTEAGVLPAVHDVSFTLKRGETLALVGESGSGKSVTSLAIMRLTPPAPRARLTGSALFRGRNGDVRDLVALPESTMESVRGNEISMIFQEPMTSLNPVLPVGLQIAEAIIYHRAQGRRQALEEAERLLELVGIAEPRRRLSAYPHHLSGGMRQRVMIAMALACDPSVLIADEPTTALDVTVQAQILELLKDLQARTGTAILFITHNLGVVAEIADRVMVMYAGRIVEQGGTVPVLKQPLMPYTKGLLRSVPRLELVGVGAAPLEAIPGNVPDPLRLPQGCSFHPRCAHSEKTVCDVVVPQMEEASPDHLLRCHRWRAIKALEA
ncbi:oligopeptide transport system ATP-binding protein [Rhizobiales bacterium GAS113]|nr:oligopeptide transport system ATP-binding protein [Rhizobiales bacterium GAS113]